MSTKSRSYLAWLVVVLSSVALIGIFGAPSLAGAAVADDGQGIAEGDQGLSVPIVPDGALDNTFEADDSFGDNYQATWIPSSDFTPYDSTTAWAYVTPGMRRSTGGSVWMDAGVRLPSGARLTLVRIYYYDPGTGNVSLRIYKNRYNVSPFTYSTLATVDSSATGYTSNFVNVAETIQNADYTYQARFWTNTANTSAFAGVRLFWYRQIRTGLTTPFTDIGSLSTDFRNAIGALYASGITSGVSPTLYGPNNLVTRAQMAAFLARALGLYWDFYSGY